MALNVELTSYVLLGLVQLKTTQDLLDASSIVRWLSKHRNSEGGFVSTQDTVVALQVGFLALFLWCCGSGCVFACSTTLMFPVSG